jgi:predicted negative regulator of RcsB-dependent stress response
MAQKITRKDLKHDEFVEAGMDAGEWIEGHWRQVAGGAAAVLAVVLLFVGWGWRNETLQARAGRLAAEGFALLAPPQSAAASIPDPAAAASKFEEAAAAAGGSPLGDVARTYRAVALFRAGRAAEAVPLLEGVAGSVDDPVLGGTARALLADALEASGNADRAAEVLRQLADAVEPAYPADMALLRLGEVRARQGRVEEARRIWQEVLSRHPESPASGQARLLLARSQATSAQ